MYSYALELVTFKGQQNANVTNKTGKMALYKSI